LVTRKRPLDASAVRLSVSSNLMRKMKLLLISIFLIFSFLYSQDTWVQFYQPFDDLLWNVEDVIECSDGGFAVNGTYAGEEYLSWGFLIKTDSEGNFLWADMDTVSFHSANESRAIVETSDDCILSASFLFSGSTALIKRDFNGNRVWIQPIDDIYIRSMSETIDGNIIVTGSSDSWPSLTKIDQDLNIMWSQTYIFEYHDWGYINSVYQASDGGFFLTGILDDDETNFSVLVIRTDANGDSLWTKILDETVLDDEGYSIIETNELDILVTGYILYQSGFIWKLDSDGNTIWFDTLQRVYDSMIKSHDGNIISLSKWGNYYISKNDSDFFNIWQENFPYYYGNGDKPFCLTSLENIIICFSDDQYVGLSKLNSEGTDANENEFAEYNQALSTFPNPFNPSTKINFEIPKPSVVNIDIYDIRGKKIKSVINDKYSEGCFSTIWDGVDSSGDVVPSGIYLISLSADNSQVAVQKCLLLK